MAVMNENLREIADQEEELSREAGLLATGSRKKAELFDLGLTQATFDEMVAKRNLTLDLVPSNKRVQLIAAINAATVSIIKDADGNYVAESDESPVINVTYGADEEGREIVESVTVV